MLIKFITRHKNKKMSKKPPTLDTVLSSWRCPGIWRISCDANPWNSHHLRGMLSGTPTQPAPVPRCCFKRRSSLAHQSLTKGRGLAAGGHQLPVWSSASNLMTCSPCLVFLPPKSWSNILNKCRAIACITKRISKKFMYEGHIWPDMKNAWHGRGSHVWALTRSAARFKG